MFVGQMDGKTAFEVQSTLAITIRGVTITWLKRFDVMESFIFLGK